MQGPRSPWPKVAIIALGALAFAALVAQAAFDGIGFGWVVAGAIATIAYAEIGHLSFGPRGRWVATVLAALLTAFVAAIATRWTLAGAGLLVVLGCAMRPPRHD